eukprot:13398583-Alexandrium_andersonii.AAC.1
MSVAGRSPGAGASAPGFSIGSGTRMGAGVAGRASRAAGLAGSRGALGSSAANISREPRSKSPTRSGL